MQSKAFDWLVLAALVAIWGSGFAALKIATTYIDPLWNTAIRIAIVHTDGSDLRHGTQAWPPPASPQLVQPRMKPSSIDSLPGARQSSTSACATTIERRDAQ